MILFALFVALNIADAVLTARVLATGGREANPVVRWITGRIGVVPGLVVVKLAGLTLVALFLMQPVVLAVMCVAMAGVVGWNAWQVWKEAKS